MIVRDIHGIIVQHDPQDPNYADGGDSAARVGIMAAFGSKVEQGVLQYYWDAPRRHPFQTRWYRVADFSRDQWIPWMAGYWAMGRVPPNKFIWRVNKDILLPDQWLHRAICSKAARWYHYPLGYLFLFLHIMWACYVRPGHELNQIASQALVAGPWWLRLLYKSHPNYNKNFREYYGGWRNQPEIAEFIIKQTHHLLGE